MKLFTRQRVNKVACPVRNVRDREDDDNLQERHIKQEISNGSVGEVIMKNKEGYMQWCWLW